MKTFARAVSYGLIVLGVLLIVVGLIAGVVVSLRGGNGGGWMMGLRRRFAADGRGAWRRHVRLRTAGGGGGADLIFSAGYRYQGSASASPAGELISADLP
jgi:hypothetical protein